MGLNEHKGLGRFPTILADYEEAINGNITPSVRELFLDLAGKDIYYYDPAGSYISLISLIRAGLVDTWLPPCVSYDAILSTWPDPPLSTVCAAMDTGIIYEYVGKGKWIPVSANSILPASSTNDGLMTSLLFDAVMEYINGPKEIYIEKGQPVPLPHRRKKNYYYNILKGIRASADEIEWIELNPVDSIEGAIRSDWPYDQMFMVCVDESSDEFGKVFEEIDPLYHVIKSDLQIKEEEVPEGYSAVYFMFDPGVMIEIIEPEEYIQGAYPNGWPYGNGFYYDENYKMSKIVSPGYKMVANDDDVVPAEPEFGVYEVYYDVLKNVTEAKYGTIVEHIEPIEAVNGAYPDGWPYDNVIYIDDENDLNKVTKPGYKSVTTDKDVIIVTPEYDVEDVYYDVLKNTIDDNETE